MICNQGVISDYLQKLTPIDMLSSLQCKLFMEKLKFGMLIGYLLNLKPFVV